MRLVCLQVTLVGNRHNALGGAPVPRFDNPILLMTRPQENSDRFITELCKIARTFQPVVSPAFENSSTGAEIPNFEAAVFTSTAGVACAPQGNGRTAYCVGNTTARSATIKGYVAINAKGSATELTSLILNRLPREDLIHIRGEVSVGNVREALTMGGVSCSEVIAYRKVPKPQNAVATKALVSDADVILPLFSAETVSILGDWEGGFGACHVIAMSNAVAVATQALGPASITISSQPTQREMVALTASMIA